MTETRGGAVLAPPPAIRGLRFRGYHGVEDHPAMLAVYAAAHAADGLEDVPTLDDFNLNYATLVNCDPTRDILLAEVDGRVIAYARVFWRDLVEGGRSYECYGWIHPAWRRRGLGTFMQRHNEAGLVEIASGHGAVDPKWLGSWSLDADAGAAVLLRGNGYEPVRYFSDMVAESLAQVVAPPMPKGIELRPVRRDEYRTIWNADVEAFRDHWGEPEPTEQDWLRWEADPHNADPRFWRIAWDADQVAGVVITTVPTEENLRHNRRRVYVSDVSVRRPWRRRGLARALLARSMIAAREAGFTSAALDVDAANPTGALRLYESLGFAEVRRSTAYRKAL